MRNKLIIASFALSGLVSAQCNMKCGYNQDENGNTVHIKRCNEYNSDEIYDQVFNRNRTKNCKINSCLILIVNKDTICWNHSKEAREIIKKEMKEKGCFNHYQYKRPSGSPYAKTNG